MSDALELAQENTIARLRVRVQELEDKVTEKDRIIAQLRASIEELTGGGG